MLLPKPALRQTPINGLPKYSCPRPATHLVKAKYTVPELASPALSRNDSAVSPKCLSSMPLLKTDPSDVARVPDYEPVENSRLQRTGSRLLLGLYIAMETSGT